MPHRALPLALAIALLPASAMATATTAASAAGATGAERGAQRLPAISVSTRLPADPRQRVEAVRVLDATELDRLRPTHANEVLARIPGAWASRGSGQEQLLALRSPVLTGPGACGAFLVLDDGVPIRPVGFCNVNQLSELHFAAAGRVEVLRGPGSAVHGSNALHGVVAVTPRRPGDGAGFGLEAGAEDFQRLRLALDGARTRLDATATDAGSFRAEESHRLLQATAQWQAGHDTRVALASHRLRQQTAGFVVGDGAWRDARRTTNANPEAFRDADALRLVVHHERPLGDGLLLLRPYARDESQTFLQHFALGQPLEQNGSQSLGLQLVFAHGDSRLGLDAEAASGWLRQTQARPLTTGTPAQNAIRPAGPHYDYRVLARQFALFGEHARDWGGHRLSAGFRIERLAYRYDNRLPDGNAAALDGRPCGFGGCLHLRPGDRRDRFNGRSLQLGWQHGLGEDWTIGARAARAFRFPQATELYRLQRGQSVEGFRPETADSLELLLRHDAGDVQFEANAYAMEKRDVILRDANGLTVAGAATRHHGIELAGRRGFGPAWVEGQLAWSEQRYAFDRVLAGNEVIRRGARIDTAPEWLGGLRIGTRAGDTTLELEGVWQGAYWIDAGNTRRYGGHALLHLRAARPLPGGWSLEARLMNLLDRRYAERVDLAFGQVRSFPGAGRQAFLGLAWSGQPAR